jgi:hypothetical protein
MPEIARLFSPAIPMDITCKIDPVLRRAFSK